MPQISFEFFSPKTISAAFSLSRAVENLAGFAPRFSSVTCSNDPAQTLETLRALRQSGLGRLQAHITCATQTPAALPAYLKAVRETGAEGIVALRGDTAPKALEVMDLIGCAKKNAMRDIFVAAYPEVHPLAQSAHWNIESWLSFRHRLFCKKPAI